MNGNGTKMEKYYRKQEKMEAKLWIKKFLLHFLTGSCKGVCIQAGLGVLSALIRNPFRKSLPHIWNSLWSKSCVQLVLFCGLYPSVYHLSVDVLTWIRQKRDGWNYGLAGAIAGLSIAVLDDSRRYSLAFYAMGRAISAGVITMVTRGHLPYIPYFEVGVFSACASVVIYCTTLHPTLLNPGYYRSLIKWSRDYSEQSLTNVFRTPGPTFVTCQEGGIHKDTCLQHHTADFVRSLPFFTKIHLPIYLVPVLLHKRKQLRERPLHVVKSVLQNISISTSFFGVMVLTAKLSLCILRNVVQAPPPLPAYIPSIAGMLCGLALLIERKSRRNELAQFMIPQTLNVLYILVRNSKIGSKLRWSHTFTVFFSLSMMSVMHAFEIETGSLTSLSKGIVRFLIGSPHKYFN